MRARSMLKTVFCLSLLMGGVASARTTDAGDTALPNDQESAYVPVADVMPEPVGGLAALVKHVTYPDAARKAGIQGKVYVVAYINENGGVDDVKVIRGLGAGCDEAAIKAVKETKFSAAKQGGAPVKAQLSIPIAFALK